MKIGILTFHWATNYGAVLQSFAFQEFLKRFGHEVYIINYRPRQYKKTLLKCIFTPRFWLVPLKLKDYIKELKLESFRKKYLNETILYESLDELKIAPPNMNIYICGSDQIWNPTFTTLGEGKITTSYYLDFGSSDIKRIAYAVSFGCEDLTNEASLVVKNQIQNFDALSVRENSGLKIVKGLGFQNAEVLCDPTLLLNSDDYFFILNNIKSKQKSSIFNYFLRGKDERVRDLNNILLSRYDGVNDSTNISSNSIIDWLSNIYNSSIVVTNSFHGMVFSIIFRKPFLVIAARGIDSGMNDRFRTVLNFVGLEERLIYSIDSKQVKELLEKEINWDLVHERISELQKSTISFLNKNL
jgi:hypothetical protein